MLIDKRNDARIIKLMVLSVKRIISFFVIVLPVLLPVDGFAQSGLKKCPSDQSLHFHNCFGTYKHVDIGRYVGEFQDNKYNGRGTYLFEDGRKYVGEFRDNQYNGFGTYTSADGDKYVGRWRDNEYNGYGTYTFADGREYVGEFRDSEYNGQGTYTFLDGQKFVGEFRNNNYNGQGTLYAADGAIKERGIYKDNVLVKSNSVEPTISLLEKNPGFKPGPVQQTPEKSALR